MDDKTRKDESVMATTGPLDDLVTHLQRTTLFGRAEVLRVIAEVVSYFDETFEQFIRRRHSELKTESLSNPDIYARIAVELQTWRVKAPTLTERQIRRVIYG
jgi:hypothetical protein